MRWAIGAASPVVAGLLVVGCGEPTAQVVRSGDSPIAFVVPSEFTRLSDDATPAAYGLPGTSLEAVSDDLVLILSDDANGDAASYRLLRTAATGGQFDPLDPTLEELPNDTVVVDYEEIDDPSVWGIRLRLTAGRAARDFQALVDRESDTITVSEVVCSQACFARELDLIEEIQGSWSLEP